MYEIKLSIKNYATLTIYTSSNVIKSKLYGSIKRTIPITDISCRETNNFIYNDAIFINTFGKKSMNYDKKLKTN